MACDDAVLAETSNPRGYASCLVSLLEKSLAHRQTNGQPSMVQAAVHRAREASLRLARILDAKRPAATRVWKPALGMVGVFFLGCVAVLPHAPQFVAIDRSMNDRSMNYRGVNQAGVSAGTVDHAYAAAVTVPSLPTGVVIPASLRTDGAVSVAPRVMTTPKFVHAHFRIRSAVETHIAAPQAIAARLNSNDANPHEGLAAIHAVVARDSAPEFRTLVFVETMQYVTADATIWSVQVWHVTVRSVVASRLARVPVANKT
jgi:hypothetical protein